MAAGKGKERSVVLSDFLGVDFSSSPLVVDARRATYAENFLKEEGRLRKRGGWYSLVRIEHEGSPCRINGIFEYKLQGRRDIIVHAGARFYLLEHDEWGEVTYKDITESSTHEGSAVDPSVLLDTRSQAFFCGGRMYVIGCGDYLVYGSWDDGESFQLRRVRNGEGTYIPRTTINIGDTSASGDIRATLDAVNLLSDFRRNSLTGPSAANMTHTGDYIGQTYTEVEYILDASIDEGTPVVIEVTTRSGESIVIKSGVKETSPDAFYICTGDGISTRSVGRIADRASGKIMLTDIGRFYDAAVPTNFLLGSGEDNIVVTFRHTVEGYATRIENARFGILFGIEGNTDRLFVSGNPDFPNVDFFTAMDDYSYFEDTNAVTLGSDSHAILGYSRLSDSTLAIFKEKSESEASIFYRTGYYSEKFDADGNLDKILPVFPTTAGTLGETVISRHACLDFGGDNLILSENGVFGIVLSDNVATAARYTRERSRSINARLCAEPALSSAAAISYRGRYYLAVGSHLYVADARYLRRAADALDSSYSYEWWYCTNVPARLFSEVDGALWFGTEDGRLCCFDRIFTDRVSYFLTEGEAIFNDVENRIVYSADAAIPIADGAVVRFYTEGLYASHAANFLDVSGERITADEDTILRLYDGTEVFADGEGLAPGVPYVIDDVDMGDCTFRLLGADGVPVVPTSAGFRLCRRISGGDYYVIGHDATGCSFALSRERGGAPLDLVLYDGATAVLPRAKVTIESPVRAVWYTPCTDLGEPEQEKTLRSMTVTCEPGIVSRLQVGYETRYGNESASAYSAGKGFSLEALSFEEFSLDTGFAVSHTVRLFERHVGHVMLRFLSEDAGECAPAGVVLRYTLDKNYRGVM